MTPPKGWADEAAGFAPLPEHDSSLAAIPDPAALRLDLIDRAKDNGATWAVIGATLGMTGREAKRHAHRLRKQARRAAP